MAPGTEDDHADPDHAGALHHVEPHAAALEAAVAFRGWLLGGPGSDRKHDRDGGRSRVRGPTYVVPADADRTDRPFDRRAPGLNHLAFHAASRRRVDDVTAGVRERDDARVLFEDRHPFADGHYALYCEGPEGVTVEGVDPGSG